MLLRLSRLSLCLAAAVAGLGFFVPAATRSTCRDWALALGATAFLLWRLAGALAQRRQQQAQADAAVLAASSLSAASLCEAAEAVERVALDAGDWESALLRSAELLRNELGARSARVYWVDQDASAQTALGVRELIAAHPRFRSPLRLLKDPQVALYRAVKNQAPCVDWPTAVAVPVVADAHVPAAIELVGMQVPVDGDGLQRLLASASASLAKRLSAQAPTPAAGSAASATAAESAERVRAAKSARSTFQCAASGPVAPPLFWAVDAARPVFATADPC